MKTVLTAAYLLTDAFGNVIIIIIAAVKIFDKQSFEFFFFAGLMFVDMIAFAAIAYYYVPYKKSPEMNQDKDGADVNDEKL